MEIPINLIKILKCPDCKCESLHYASAAVICDNCNRHYNITHDNIIKMMPLSPIPLPKAYENKAYIDFQKMLKLDPAKIYYSDMNKLFKKIHYSSHQILHQWHQDYINGGYSIDLGCGLGAYFTYIDNFEKMFGLDLSLESLMVARRRFNKAILIQGDSCNLPFADKVFNSVLSIYNLEHLYHLGIALNEIYRILKDEGRLFLGLPAEGGLAWNLGRKISTERIYKSKFKVDYKTNIKIDHCNTCNEVIKKCLYNFTIEKCKYYPFSFLPIVDVNLTISLMLKKLV